MSKKAKSLLDQVSVSTPSARKSTTPQMVLSATEKSLVDRYCAAQKRFKEAETEKEQVGGEVKEFARAKFAVNAAEQQETSNLKMEGDEGAVQYIVMKKFSAVSEEQKATIEQAGLGEFIERDQIQLADGISVEDQARILTALAREFGKDQALAIVYTRYRVNVKAMDLLAATGKAAKVENGMQFLKPVEQLRASS